ncbi:PrsW family glutamic-type intramembrane protease [Patescibacteria group bacterium]
MAPIFKSFIYGILTALLALLAQLVIFSFLIDTNRPSDLRLIETLPSFLLIAVLVEEVSKFFFTFNFLKSFSKTGLDLIANSLIAGIGFTVTEISLFLYKYTEPTQTDYIELIKVGLLHISTFGIIAYFSSSQEKASSIFIKAIITTTLLHFVFNFSVIQEVNFFKHIPIGVIILSVILNIYHTSTINKKLAI